MIQHGCERIEEIIIKNVISNDKHENFFALCWPNPKHDFHTNLLKILIFFSRICYFLTISNEFIVFWNIKQAWLYFLIALYFVSGLTNMVESNS